MKKVAALVISLVFAGLFNIANAQGTGAAAQQLYMNTLIVDSNQKTKPYDRLWINPANNYPCIVTCNSADGLDFYTWKLTNSNTSQVGVGYPFVKQIIAGGGFSWPGFAMDKNGNAYVDYIGNTGQSLFTATGMASYNGTGGVAYNWQAGNLLDSASVTLNDIQGPSVCVSNITPAVPYASYDLMPNNTKGRALKNDTAFTPPSVLVDPSPSNQMSVWGSGALNQTSSVYNGTNSSIGITYPEYLSGAPSVTASDIYAQLTWLSSLNMMPVSNGGGVGIPVGGPLGWLSGTVIGMVPIGTMITSTTDGYCQALRENSGGITNLKYTLWDPTAKIWHTFTLDANINSGDGTAAVTGKGDVDYIAYASNGYSYSYTTSTGAPATISVPGGLKCIALRQNGTSVSSISNTLIPMPGTTHSYESNGAVVDGNMPGPMSIDYFPLNGVTFSGVVCIAYGGIGTPNIKLAFSLVDSNGEFTGGWQIFYLMDCHDCVGSPTIILGTNPSVKFASHGVPYVAYIDVNYNLVYAGPCSCPTPSTTTTSTSGTTTSGGTTTTSGSGYTLQYCQCVGGIMLSAQDVSQSEIDLSWTANISCLCTYINGYGMLVQTLEPANIMGFTILMSPPNMPGNFTQIGTAGPGTTSYQVTGLQPDTTYSFEIVANTGCGCSVTSNIASATTGSSPLVCPYNGLSLSASNVVTYAVDNGTFYLDDWYVFLNWQLAVNDPNIAGFMISVGTTIGNMVPIANVGPNVNGYQVLDLQPDTTYYFQVMAYNWEGCQYASVTSLTTPNIAPPPPGAQPIKSVMNFDKWWGKVGGVLKKHPTLADFDKAVKANPKDAGAYLNRGAAKYKLGDYKGALDDFDNAIGINPKDAMAFTSKGITEERIGDRKGALADLDKAIGINPDIAEAYTCRGIAKDGLGDHKGALADYDKSLQLNPEDVEAYTNRGNVKDVLGDHKGAISDYDKAIDINPKDAKAYYNRGVAKYNLNDYKGAFADSDKAIGINSKDADSYHNRGAARYALGDYKGALADYDKALELKPDYAQAYYSRGIAKGEHNDRKGEISDYDRAISISPNYALAYYNRGNAKEATGDHKGALADFDRAISINPQDAEAYANRATAKYNLNDYNGAIKDWGKAVELTPSLKNRLQSNIDAAKAERDKNKKEK